MTAWKLQDRRHSTANPKVSSDVAVLVAPNPDGAFAFAGTLLLDEAESNDLQARLNEGLTPQEYRRLVEFLTEWEEQDEEARKLAEIVRLRFGPLVGA